MYITTIFLFTLNWACIWPLLLAAILPFLLGYWFRHLLAGRDRDRIHELEEENRRMHGQLTALDKEQAELKYQKGELEKDLNAMRATLRKEQSDHAVLKARYGSAEGDSSSQQGIVDAKLRLASGEDISFSESELVAIRDEQYGALFTSNNLQVIEGVGPKVEQILKDSGINDWGTLAFTSAGQLGDILKKARLTMMNPDTWPQQAALARDGKWNELAEYQRFLDGGSETKGDFDTPAKIDNLARASGKLQGGALAARDAQVNYGMVFTPDNLEIIEGIGPKVSKLLKANGYDTWQKLGEVDSVRLKELLSANKLQMLDPDTWPQQAKLAAQDRWKELVEYQKFLDAGRQHTGEFTSASKVEQMAIKLFGFKDNPDDLKIVEGIGPKIEGLLKDAGITNWTDLAGSTEARLQEILDLAGPRYRLAKPATWPKQASLAAQGKWDELKKLQDHLQGGNDPLT